MRPIVELIGVELAYGRGSDRNRALRDVTLAVDEGAMALLWGPSGAGKSSLLRLVLAMARPERGVVRVAERDIFRLRAGSVPYLRRNVGAIFQDFKLLADATPRQNVALALEVLGVSRRDVRARVSEVLEQVELDPDLRRPVCQLSGGEQQRVAVARALAARPSVLLADEPTGNLDPRLSREILELLARVRASGTTVLLATHDPAVRERVEVTQELHLEDGVLVHDSLETAKRYARDAPSEQPLVAPELVGAVA